MYLDSQGLVALWREGLLAQKVLAGKTKGYKHHPQLIRFKNMQDPLAAIGSYLRHVEAEASRRDYHFDHTKILKMGRPGLRIIVTTEQLKFETVHLLRKLKLRDRALYAKFRKLKSLKPHPLLRKTVGNIEEWEIIPARK